ncbi:LysR family transcriptional regulator [Pararhodobacter zhoushanensis]|uniref:LysR family transcriptional regulator n=1 Tax=Pararhodobacter zhoushanensis TaxID=2479545 RepID=A0ABT3GXP4_9RHOB|nr:LysR family transcriptional regulator [Pararhodobacter zhoushanensis]MCW1932287.1 LysR family transcriptional regulator [Pararhodobacter zhoushanensis]
MKNIDIPSLDLKALHLLCRIHDAGSLSLAAERSGIAQSTASHTLERLRQALGDPLFHRAPRGMRATARCEAIIAQLRPLLDSVHDLGREADFDIARESAPYTIAGNFYERCLILPPLLRLLRREAPNLPVTVIPADFSPQRLLQEHRCDLALSPVPLGHGKLRAQTLFTEAYACFVDPSSHIAQQGLDLDGFAQARHLGVVYAEGWRPFWQAELARQGIGFEPVVRVPSFGGVERLILDSDLVLTAPARLAELFCPILTAVPAPFDSVLTLRMLWSPATDSSPRHRWMRDAVLRACRESRGDAPDDPQNFTF